MGFAFTLFLALLLFIVSVNFLHVIINHLISKIYWALEYHRLIAAKVSNYFQEDCRSAEMLSWRVAKVLNFRSSLSLRLLR